MLHRADHLGDRPQADARAARRKRDAAAGVHQVGRRLGAPGAQHRGVPVGLARRHPLGAAAQPQAQPGAARAGADPHRAGRGGAATSMPATRLEVHDAGEGFYRVILHYGFMEEVDIPRDLAGIDSMRRAVQHDEHQLLPRPAEADRLEGPAGHGAVARAAVRVDDARARKARWSSSSCRPTGWSSSAASCRSSCRGTAIASAASRLSLLLRAVPTAPPGAARARAGPSCTARAPCRGASAGTWCRGGSVRR